MSRFRKKARVWQDTARAMMARESPSPYEPLANQNIFRLLKLPSRMGEFCQLEYIPHDDCPKYTALSYTRDSPLLDQESIEAYNNVQCPFLVNLGKVARMIHISKSLDEALSYINTCRYCGKVDLPDYIWADSICINRHDKEERGKQVPLMGEIYSNCGTHQTWKVFSTFMTSSSQSPGKEKCQSPI
ncbi:MAG: hypothetical protein Q9197_001358 [Variospora fuerteventurae]